MNTNTFYKDYSNNEYDGWAILKSNNKSEYIIFETIEYKAGKARVKPESMDKDVFQSLYAAMQALRGKVKDAKSKKSVNAELEHALNRLGIKRIETREQVMKAFRSRVKAHADGQGGYTGDMDLLVKAKEYALQHAK